ncbi:MAG: SDR family NAD(P)-dependent oxidoreductase, partial [Leptolyngbya sp. SIO4C1]|nr:SDR family NAD(P)-dependent oxidoreductase [Leptolyngbya sp. SIO4C1]
MTNPTAKTALVTGGNGGIGMAICQGLLGKGFDILLAARSQDKAKAAISQLQTGNSTIYPIVLDVTDDDSIAQAVADARSQIDALHVLINNAGIYPDEGVDMLTVSRDLLNLTMSTNAFGPIKVIQAFLPLLEQADDARVINMSSGNGQLDGLSTNAPSYSLSKLALNGITILMAEALRPKQIAVYAMCPGWVRTDMGGSSAPRSPEEGADTAIWLATEATFKHSGKFFRDRQ